MSELEAATGEKKGGGDVSGVRDICILHWQLYKSSKQSSSWCLKSVVTVCTLIVQSWSSIHGYRFVDTGVCIASQKLRLPLALSQLHFHCCQNLSERWVRRWRTWTNERLCSRSPAMRWLTRAPSSWNLHNHKVSDQILFVLPFIFMLRIMELTQTQGRRLFFYFFPVHYLVRNGVVQL